MPEADFWRAGFPWPHKTSITWVHCISAVVSPSKWKESNAALRCIMMPSLASLQQPVIVQHEVLLERDQRGIETSGSLPTH